jgi:NTP pyrophosphatase (non-canonical NTP hydrolase)
MMEKSENVEHIEEVQVKVNGEFKFSNQPSMEDIRHIQHEFCNIRNWTQYQTPRNLLLALVGEVGELAELFQWKGMTHQEEEEE